MIHVSYCDQPVPFVPLKWFANSMNPIILVSRRGFFIHLDFFVLDEGIINFALEYVDYTWPSLPCKWSE